MPGSPFSNVLGQDPDDSTFKNVESTQVGDTTTETAGRPVDTPGESSIGLTETIDHTVHEAGEDETQGQSDLSGTNVTGT